MKVKELVLGVKLVAQPRQYHSLTVDVSPTFVFDPPEEFAPAAERARREVSDVLVRGVYEELRKLYGEVVATTTLTAYFGQGHTIPEDPSKPSSQPSSPGV